MIDACMRRAKGGLDESSPYITLSPDLTNALKGFGALPQNHQPHHLVALRRHDPQIIDPVRDKSALRVFEVPFDLTNARYPCLRS
jgi:hypothetical protein